MCPTRTDQGAEGIDRKPPIHAPLGFRGDGMQDIIRAQITDNNTATACNITCKGRTPILTLCRALLRKADGAQL